MAYAIALLPQAAEARSFIVYNISAPAQTYFIVNGTSGNVGIGTTNPLTSLHLSGSNPTITLQTTNFGYASVDYWAYNRGYITSRVYGAEGSAVGRGVLLFYNRNDTGSLNANMIIDGQYGNVGIGTTNPGANLEIYTNAASTNSIFKLSTGSSAGYPQLFLNYGAGGTDAKLWDFLVTSNTLNGRVVNDANTIANNWLNVSRSGTTVSSVSFPNGNVGVGTANPGAKLDVNGDVKASTIALKGTTPSASYPLYLETGNTGAFFRFVDTNAGGGSIQMNSGGSGTPSTLYINDLDGVVINQQNPGYMAFATTNAERMRIDSSGNVGIGVTSPSARLSVVNTGATEIGGTAMSSTFRTSAGTLGTTAGSELALGSIGFIAGTNNVALGVRGYRASGGTDWTTTSIGLEMDVDNSVRLGPSIWLNSAGNVGIGTATPGYLLDVAGAAHASSFPTSSDIRFKANITELDNVLPKLENIRAVTFDWNAEYKKLGRATNGTQIGVIAQEVEKQFPELVTKFNAGGNITDARSVDYGRLSAVLLEGMKEQQKQISQLKSIVCQDHPLAQLCN